MNDVQFKSVLTELVEDGVRVITLNRPDSLNAMNRTLIDDVAGAFNHANACPETRAIVFTGAGRAFCAGDDRNEHVHPQNEAQARDFVEAIQRATEAIIFGPKPVVGAINGWAVGGGLEWAINCDFPIWAKSARGFFPEVSLNLFVTGAVTALLPAIAGVHRTREMIMLGERYDAQTLLEYGIAWRLADDSCLGSEALAVARKLAAQPPASLQATKRVMSTASTTDVRHAITLETNATVAAFMDPETTRRLKDSFSGTTD